MITTRVFRSFSHASRAASSRWSIGELRAFLASLRFRVMMLTRSLISNFSSSALLIETLAALFPHFAAGNHPAQQRAGPELLPQLRMESTQDFQADVQTDEIGQFQRPHGMVRSE